MFMFFGRKDTETGQIFVHELTFFHKYHMPLKCVYIFYENG